MMTPRAYDRRNTNLVRCRLSAGHAALTPILEISTDHACDAMVDDNRSDWGDRRPSRVCWPTAFSGSSAQDSVKSRGRRSNCNLARIDHTCPGRNGGFGPVSLPSFHAGRRGLAIGDEELLSFMVSLLLRDLPDCDDVVPAR